MEMEGRHIGATTNTLTSNATPTEADGEAIDLPFINMSPWRVHLKIGAISPPGRDPKIPPSVVGPRLDLHSSQLIICAIKT